MNLTAEFAALIAALQEETLDFAVCGGMAMALHGFPRFTRDIDLLILPADLGRVRAIAAQCGFESISETLSMCGAKQSPCIIERINKFSGEDHLILDLILVGPSLQEVWQGRTRFVWQERSLPVVTAVGLAKMKRLAGRPQDLVDLAALGFDPDDPALQP